MRYRDLFKNREFTALYIADVVSTTCSYLARIAVAALIYHRTHSTAWTAAAVGITYAPYLLSPWLATVADHYPRRTVLLVCEVARGILTSFILISSLPIWTIFCLIFLVELFRVPWGSARLPLLTEIFSEKHFAPANAVLQSTGQALQLLGYFVGGLVTAAVGSRTAIAADAITYGVAALILTVFLKRRPSPARDSNSDSSLRPGRRAAEGLRMIARTQRLQYLLLLLAIGPAVAIVSEGLAIPLAHELGHSTALAGAIMAASPLGQVIGMLAIGTMDRHLQQRLLVPLALGTAMFVTLAGITAKVTASIPLILVFLALSSVCLGYLIVLQSEIASLIPDNMRGRLFGIAAAILELAQGGAIFVAGAAAAIFDVPVTLIAAGVVGAVVLTIAGTRMARSTGPRSAYDRPRGQ